MFVAKLDAMADDEQPQQPPYTYTGRREPGISVTISVEVDGEVDGEPAKVTKTKKIKLLGARSTDYSVDQGKAAYPNGDSYEGGYRQGLRHFSGKYTYASVVPAEDEEPKPPKGMYDGGFKAGLKSGRGVMAYADGSKYHGEYKEGLRCGKGTCYYVNGDIYSGQWVGGKKEGAGVYMYKASGAKLDGTWFAGAPTFGTFTDSHGGCYTGAFAGSAAQPVYVPGARLVTPAGAAVVLAA